MARAGKKEREKEKKKQSQTHFLSLIIFAQILLVYFYILSFVIVSVKSK